ncbi:MAG: hypothetical protein GY940_10625 [bacterium]|nr:hypothetical protein [bacterium]
MSDMFSSYSEIIRRDLAIFPLKADELSHFFIENFKCTKTNYSRDFPPNTIDGL